MPRLAADIQILLVIAFQIKSRTPCSWLCQSVPQRRNGRILQRIWNVYQYLSSITAGRVDGDPTKSLEMLTDRDAYWVEHKSRRIEEHLGLMKFSL